ncbi:hypothetical protein PIB30_085883 [Stylosanthes scabra]|uniref:Uncharacterized protein n=1 Tax=Stylosanthes scabra TaxID=79078 RepID=A0ABU6UUR3_9FABA|nr:hypothetical protein [Stylosanthes scabra]
MASTGGFFPLLFRRPAVVLSVTASRGEGSPEYHQDLHLVGPVLGNGAVDPTLAVTVSCRRRGDVAAATTTVEPLYSRKAATVDFSYNPEAAVVLPRSLVFAVLPISPVFAVLQ